MIASWVLWFLFQGISISEARPPLLDLPLRSDFQLSSDPLTTEKVWELDPGQRNPHLQKWVLHRDVKLMGLKAIPVEKNESEKSQYRIKASALVSTSQGYVRAPGPWYRPMEEFSCEQKPNSWFETQEGAQQAISKAHELWLEQLSQESVKLSLLLERVKGDTEESAIKFGQIIFKNWLKQVENEWRESALPKARNSEWSFYRQEAAETGLCTGGALKAKSSPPAKFLWKSMMEPFSGNPPQSTQLLARAPARLWNGLFSVRLSIKVGGKVLNGRFLIDSGANVSVMSSSWLESQGILPIWVEIPGAPLERPMWSGLWKSEGGLAKRAYIDRIELSGLAVPLHEFLLTDTDFFSPPDSVGTCCDGILGNDFLRIYPIEFQSNAPPEVRVWPRESFHWSDSTPWIEISEVPSGNLVSSCIVVPDLKEGQRSSLVLPGVRWDLGSEDALQIHTPWHKSVENKNELWKVFCDSLEIARGVRAGFPQSPGGNRDGGAWTLQVPSVSLGMPLLSRGNFTMDLPHGRLWLEKDGLSKSLPSQNRSGLILHYVMRKDGRELRVEKILPKSPAQSLVKAGLKVGALITQIDDQQPEDIDLWEVQRRLGGHYGDHVTLQWLTPKGLKMAPLELSQ